MVPTYIRLFYEICTKIRFNYNRLKEISEQLVKQELSNSCSLHIVTCMIDSRLGYGLAIEFIDHLDDSELQATTEPPVICTNHHSTS